MRHPIRARTEGTRGSQSGFSLLEVIIVVIIVMVMAAMAAKWMGAAVSRYRLSGTAHEIAASAQLARIKATTGDARFKVKRNTSPVRTYRTEFKTRTGSWTLDPLSADYPLPTDVNFDTTGISAAPPGQTTTQATAMVFNTRGLLINDSSGAPVDGRCFYLQGNTDRPFAVCANLTGKITVYRRFGSVWEIQ